MSHRIRFALFYIAAWLVLYVMYAAMLFGNPGMTVKSVQYASFFTVVPASLLGLAVWGLCRAIGWPDSPRGRFFAFHFLAAIGYTGAWAFCTVSQIAIFESRDVLTMFVQRGLGWQIIMGLLIYSVIAGVAYGIQATNRLAEQRALAARAELQALRSQLNPHFLFNTLHSITSLASVDSGAVESALIRFGSLLRYVLDAGKRDDEDATVEAELGFVRGYLDLEKIRLGDRLRVRENIDGDALDCLIPVLTLQPLVENAVFHGISSRAGGGEIRISVKLVGDFLRIEIGDDGPGSTVGSGKTGGLGLPLVSRRIEMRFPGKGTTSVSSTPAGFSVVITVPAESMNVEKIALTAERTRALLASRSGAAPV